MDRLFPGVADAPIETLPSTRLTSDKPYYTRSTQRLLISLVMGGAALCASIPVAFAHAKLDHAVPAVDSTVDRPPSEVRIWFSEPLEPSYGAIEVLDSEGRHMERGKAILSATDPRLLEVGLLPLAAGTYKVHWQAVSVDTHRTEGAFAFAVRQ
jgi:copper resistance protein C